MHYYAYVIFNEVAQVSEDDFDDAFWVKSINGIKILPGESMECRILSSEIIPNWKSTYWQSGNWETNLKQKLIETLGNKMTLGRIDQIISYLRTQKDCSSGSEKCEDGEIVITINDYEGNCNADYAYMKAGSLGCDILINGDMSGIYTNVDIG